MWLLMRYVHHSHNQCKHGMPLRWLHHDQQKDDANMGWLRQWH